MTIGEYIALRAAAPRDIFGFPVLATPSAGYFVIDEETPEDAARRLLGELEEGKA